MKAITLWQPWASLLACGAKQYETRSWATTYRGPIAIHAGKEPWHLTLFQGNRPLQDAVIRAFGGEPDHERGSARGGNFYLPYSAVIATAELVGCWSAVENIAGGVLAREVLTREKRHILTVGNESLFGDFAPGRYAWEFKNMKMLDTPIPVKGGQRIWNWKNDTSISIT